LEEVKTVRKTRKVDDEGWKKTRKTIEAQCKKPVLLLLLWLICIGLHANKNYGGNGNVSQKSPAGLGD
jgi:hypothetical protein